jgi:hypothetical protein
MRIPQSNLDAVIVERTLKLLQQAGEQDEAAHSLEGAEQQQEERLFAAHDLQAPKQARSTLV